MSQLENHEAGTGQVENWPDEAELRMAVILQNGNDGEHYAELESRHGCGRCATCSCGEPKP